MVIKGRLPMFCARRYANKVRLAMLHTAQAAVFQGTAFLNCTAYMPQITVLLGNKRRY